MSYLIIGAVCLVLGAAGGWIAKGKYGTKVAAVVTAVEAPPKP